MIAVVIGVPLAAVGPLGTFGETHLGFSPAGLGLARRRRLN